MKKKWWFLIIGMILGCSSEKNKISLEEFPQKWYYGQPARMVLKGVDPQTKVIKFQIDQEIRGGAKIRDTIILPALQNVPLGPHEITFYIPLPEGKSKIIKKKFTLFAARPPQKLGYEPVNVYPHDQHAFTQGLEFSGDTLYESTGQYGKSSLRKWDFKTNKIFQLRHFDDNIFAEGLTVWHDSVLVLTWQNGKGFIFNRKLQLLGEFPYGKSKEGWGLCHDSLQIYKSDGTEKIWILDPVTLREKGFINVYGYKNKIKRINELEWVEGYIFTNIWQKNAIAVIDPNTGEVKYVMDLSALVKEVKKHPDLDVLNGIAWHPERKTLFVTEKNWDKIFELKLNWPPENSEEKNIMP